MTKLYEKIPSNILFITTILCFPAVLFQAVTFYLWINVLLFLLLLFCKNGRVKILPSLFILLSIIFFNLLTPTGKVYIYIGDFAITEGALFFGLQKAGILLSMVFISQYAITKDLSLPGKIGFFLNSMFYFFERLTDHKAKFNVKKPFISIDDILLEVYKSEDNIVEKTKKSTSSFSFVTYFICVIPLIISYTLLILSIV